MPELPEVETIKCELAPHVIGHSITGATLFWEGIVRQPSPHKFRSKLVGQRVTGISRRGKYLIFNLAGGEKLVIHLRMTGSLLVKASDCEPERYVRAILYFDDGTAIHFRDLRKFGRMWLVKDENDIVNELGPEPLGKSFTPELLQKLLKNRHAPIKALLIDQNLIAGIGNMYADEALFASRIHPLRAGGSLTPEEIKRLHGNIRRILRAAIENKGASTDTYIRPSGEIGTAHYQFKVAHRLGGEQCPVCGTPIERITVRNRGTYFCPRCQRIKS